MVYFAIIVLYNFTMNDFTDLRNRWLQHEEKILKTCRQFKMKKPLGQVHATLNNKTGKIYYTINYKNGKCISVSDDDSRLNPYRHWKLVEAMKRSAYSNINKLIGDQKKLENYSLQIQPK